MLMIVVGEIPASLGQLTNLTILFLECNRLSGKLLSPLMRTYAVDDSLQRSHEISCPVVDIVQMWYSKLIVRQTSYIFTLP